MTLKHNAVSQYHVILIRSLSYADARQLKPSFSVFSTRKVNTNSQKDKSVLRSSGGSTNSTTITELVS